MEARLVAVLEIGSTGIRLLVAEILSGGQWKAVDRAEKNISLGRDVFTSGGISRESLLECLLVLKNYRELLGGWGIRDGDIHIIATSALRAARNRDLFVDRVRQETGFRLSVVEGIEENRLMYLAVRFALKQDLPLFWRANSMIIEIGGVPRRSCSCGGGRWWRPTAWGWGPSSSISSPAWAPVPAASRNGT
jgi:exopolyphosphatase/guanosine-5'-triphosphate,3'-diphosphate pyrophosphatase